MQPLQGHAGRISGPGARSGALPACLGQFQDNRNPLTSGARPANVLRQQGLGHVGTQGLQSLRLLLLGTSTLRGRLTATATAAAASQSDKASRLLDAKSAADRDGSSTASTSSSKNSSISSKHRRSKGSAAAVAGTAPPAAGTKRPLPPLRRTRPLVSSEQQQQQQQQQEESSIANESSHSGAQQQKGKAAAVPLSQVAHMDAQPHNLEKSAAASQEGTLKYSRQEQRQQNEQQKEGQQRRSRPPQQAQQAQQQQEQQQQRGHLKANPSAANPPPARTRRKPAPALAADANVSSPTDTMPATGMRAAMPEAGIATAAGSKTNGLQPGKVAAASKVLQAAAVAKTARAAALSTGVAAAQRATLLRARALVRTKLQRTHDSQGGEGSVAADTASGDANESNAASSSSSGSSSSTAGNTGAGSTRASSGGSSYWTSSSSSSSGARGSPFRVINSTAGRGVQRSGKSSNSRGGRRGSNSREAIFGDLQAPQVTGKIIAADGYEALEEILTKAGSKLNSIHLSAIMSQLPRLAEQEAAARGSRSGSSGGARRVMALMEPLQEQLLPSFSMRDVITTIWAWSKLDIQPSNPRLFKGCLAALADPRRSHDISAQGITMSAYALARMGIRDTAIWALLQGQLLQRLGQFEPQQLSNFAWALATLGDVVVDASVVQGIASEAKRNADNFKPQEVANMAWALTLLGHTRADTHVALLDGALPRINRFKPQEVCNIMWAVAQSNSYRQQPFQALCDAALALSPRFNAQDVANLAWAMAEQTHYDGRLLDSLVAHMTAKCSHFSPQGISNTLWGLATLYHKPESPEMRAMLAEVARSIEEKGGLSGYTVQQLANLAWALVVLGDYNQPLLNEVVDQLDSMPSVSKMDTDGGSAWRQLHQVMRMMAVVGKPLKASQKLLDSCQGAWRSSMACIITSPFQLDVAAALRRLGLPTRVEFSPNEEIKFDIVVQIDGINVAIEADGPTHYTRSQPPRPLGGTQLRNCWCHHSGFKVGVVPGYAWSSLHSDEAKEGFMKGVLADTVPEQAAARGWVVTAPEQRRWRDEIAVGALRPEPSSAEVASTSASVSRPIRRDESTVGPSSSAVSGSRPIRRHEEAARVNGAVAPHLSSRPRGNVRLGGGAASKRAAAAAAQAAVAGRAA